MNGVARVATLADADAIGAVHVQAWRETYPRILPERVLASLSPVSAGGPMLFREVAYAWDNLAIV